MSLKRTALFAVHFFLLYIDENDIDMVVLTRRFLLLLLFCFVSAAIILSIKLVGYLIQSSIFVFPVHISNMYINNNTNKYSSAERKKMDFVSFFCVCF